MNYNTFEKVLYKMKNNGAQGNDLISTYWIKSLVCQFDMVYEQNATLPEWLVTGRTVLLPKSNETAQSKKTIVQ